jgi:beta-N-acetylhexosaminidase
MENIGELVITGIKGVALSKEEEEVLTNYKIGGVILFTNNYEDPAQLTELINSIQKCRSEMPLFIGVDHEGGRVIRFKKHFTQFPSMYQISKANSPKLIYEVHSMMARELKACGVNLSFSPVCDIWTNPENKVVGDRSFGHDVETVEKMLSAAIRGLQSNGIIACAKHFPGHGNTLKDSHYDLPLIKDSLASLKNREILPFVKASKSRVEMMMMAHLLIDAIDDQKPTTVSESAYNLLRSETKFTKIIITDDMEMKAIADRYSIEEAAVMSINAGADIVLYRFLEDAVRAVTALDEAVKKKLIKKDEILLKQKRISAVKKEYLSGYKPVYFPEIQSSFGTSEAKALIDEINRETSK